MNTKYEDEPRRLYLNFNLAQNWSKLPKYRMFRQKNGRFCNRLVEITESVSMLGNAKPLGGEIGFIGWGRFVEIGEYNEHRLGKSTLSHNPKIRR